MKMTRNGERRSIASPTTISLFFNVLGLEMKSLLTQKFLPQRYKNILWSKFRTVMKKTRHSLLVDVYGAQSHSGHESNTPKYVSIFFNIYSPIGHAWTPWGHVRMTIGIPKFWGSFKIGIHA